VNFKKAMEHTRAIHTEASYAEDELELLWNYVTAIPLDYSTVLEVGCEMGRSTSILAQACQEEGHRLVCIDPFHTYDGAASEKFLRRMVQLKYPFTLHIMTTLQAGNLGLLPTWLDLVHIDGDHSFQGIMDDCRLLLPTIRGGGFAVFHDYGNSNLPHVKEVVDYYREAFNWESTEEVGSCFVMRKPK